MSFPVDHANNNTQNHSPRSCPCKRLPYVLSSLTAAEYGNVAALNERLLRRNVAGGASSSSSFACDSGGNTPLHFAAQHGHVAACLLLLQQSSLDHNHDGMSTLINASDGGATPLHRASFSGAVATMRLLVQYPQCDLLARDTSFGDAQTPLHKAVSGGRYLAVQLLVNVLHERGLLSQALAVVDARGDTPLELAVKHCNQHATRLAEYAQAVARWNQVAGGLPDWEQCATILKVAAAAKNQTINIDDPDDINEDSMATMARSGARRPGEDGKASTLNIPPPTCVTCDDCLSQTTATWEAAFRAVLETSVPRNKRNDNESDVNERIRKETVGEDRHDKRDDAIPSDQCAGIQSINIESPPPPRSILSGLPPTETVSHPQGQDTGIGMGRACDSCQALCMALFPKNGKLVCRACYRRRR